jgi:hypothetical protein
MWTPGKPSIPPRIETNQQFAQDVPGRQQAFEKRAADGPALRSGYALPSVRPIGLLILIVAGFSP